MTTTTLNPQTIVRQALRLIERHTDFHNLTGDEAEVRDKVIANLEELARALPTRTQVATDLPPLHQAPRPSQDLAAMQEEWIKRNGNPRLPAELREVADAIGDIEL